MIGGINQAAGGPILPSKARKGLGVERLAFIGTIRTPVASNSLAINNNLLFYETRFQRVNFSLCYDI